MNDLGAFVVTRGRKPAVTARPPGFGFENVGGIEKQVYLQAIPAEPEGPPSVVVACQAPGAQYLTFEQAIELADSIRNEALQLLADQSLDAAKEPA